MATLIRKKDGKEIRAEKDQVALLMETKLYLNPEVDEIPDFNQEAETPAATKAPEDPVGKKAEAKPVPPKAPAAPKK